MKKLLIILTGLITMAISAKGADSIPSGPIVDLKTTLGDIKIKLYDDTPRHRDNFLKNVSEGIYNGVLFHRVIKDFMVQSGDPESVNADSTQMLGGGDLGYTVEAEILYPKYYHKYGALAAARTGDDINPEFRSSASQFYIVTGKKYSDQQLTGMEQKKTMEKRQAYFMNLSKQNIAKIKELQTSGDRDALEKFRQELISETEKNVPEEKFPENIRRDYTTIGGTPHLDGKYTVYGEVIEGMDVVEKIQNVETGRADRPKEDIRIISAQVEK